MSDFFKNNLVALREFQKENQLITATALGLNRSTYANYEGGANLPKADVLFKIVRHFNISFEDLMSIDLSNAQLIEKYYRSKKSNYAQPNAQQSAQLIAENKSVYGHQNPNAYFGMPRIITADSNGNDNIVHVPIKSRAGYLTGYGDAEFMETLPTYNIPFLRAGTFRSFEVEGASMKPTVLHKDYVVGQWVEGFKDIRENRVHIIVTKNDGVLIKRVLNRIESRGKLYLKSDSITNKSDYPTLEIDPTEVAEIWYARIRFSPDFSEPSEIYTRIHDFEIDLFEIKKHLGFVK